VQAERGACGPLSPFFATNAQLDRAQCMLALQIRTLGGRKLPSSWLPDVRLQAAL